MGYVKPSSVERIYLPSDPAYWVDWKDHVLYGAIKVSAQAATKVGPRGEAEVDASAATDAMLLLYIADWNLDDESGVKLPLTSESLALLEDVDANFLSTKLQERMNKQAADRKN